MCTDEMELLQDMLLIVVGRGNKWEMLTVGAALCLCVWAVLCLVVQSCLILFDPWTVTLQAPLSMGIRQARIMEWVAMPFSRGSSHPWDQTQVSCIKGEFFTI